MIISKSDKRGEIHMNQFLIYLLALFLLFILIYALERGLNRLLGVKKRNISDTPGKRVDRWGRITIVVCFFCGLPFFMNSEHTQLWFLLYISLSMVFQIILERIYLKGSKQYISSFILSLLVLSFCILLLQFMKSSS